MVSFQVSNFSKTINIKAHHFREHTLLQYDQPKAQKTEKTDKKMWTIQMCSTIKCYKNFVVRVFVAFVGIFIINTKAIVCQKKWTFGEKRKIPFNAFKWFFFSLSLSFWSIYFPLFSTSNSNTISIFMMWLWTEILFWQISSFFRNYGKTAKCDRSAIAWASFNQEKSGDMLSLALI